MIPQHPSTSENLALAHSSIPHFQEPGGIDPVQPGDQMPEALYSAVLDYLVIACVDIIFTHANQLLLAKRNRYPNPAWWIVGGRMTAGEVPENAASRKAAEEANLGHLAASRFQYVGVYSTRLAFRHQTPQNHGLHSLNLTYQIELTQSEKAQLFLSSSEYETWKWVDVSEVEHFLETDRPMDQALLRVIQDVELLNRAIGFFEGGAECLSQKIRGNQ